MLFGNLAKDIPFQKILKETGRFGSTDLEEVKELFQRWNLESGKGV